MQLLAKKSKASNESDATNANFHIARVRLFNSCLYFDKRLCPFSKPMQRKYLYCPDVDWIRYDIVHGTSEMEEIPQKLF